MPAAFESWRSYDRFARTVTFSMRYIQSPEIQSFLGTLLDTLESREQTILAGALLWRAQLGYVVEQDRDGDTIVSEQPQAYDHQRMKPLRDRAREGRVNPKGIPCLYVSTDGQTAMAEVRPWIGSQISLARLKTDRDIRIVNIWSEKETRKVYFSEPSDAERTEAVWAAVGDAFSRPVAVEEDTAGYVPTQVISEFFKSHGYDGVAFRSSLGTGYNIALFDLDVAKIVNCVPHETRKISFEFESVGNGYFVKDPGSE